MIRKAANFMERDARRGPLAALLMCGAFLSGCGREEEAESAAPVPSIKTIEVRPQDAVQERNLSGTLIVAEETKLSFAVSGKLNRCPPTRRLGIQNRTGNCPSRPAGLPARPRQSEVETAVSQDRAQDAEETFRRQSTLAASGTVSKAALSRAEASLANARADRQIAEVAVATAEENLRRATLIAPRDGIVTKLMAKQYEEIAAGQPVYEVGRQDAMEVVVLVPEQFVPGLKYGNSVTATIPGLQEAAVKGHIVEIGATAEAGNAFRVRARLDDPTPRAQRHVGHRDVARIVSRCGPPSLCRSIVGHSLRHDRNGTRSGSACHALCVRSGKAGRPAKGSAGDRHGWQPRLCNGGLTPGDRIATAGVAFLRDGQKARLWSAPE